MIEIERPYDGNILEVSLSGELTGAAYDETVLPAIEAALSDHEHIRVLLIAPESFSGFDLSGAWADAKMGLSHWSGFDRVAVATDKGWIRNTMRLMGGIMPCPVQVFSMEEVDEARRWLRESLGAVHVRGLGGTSVHVQALGTFEPEVLNRARGELSTEIGNSDSFRLLLDLREFEGWEGLSSLPTHIGLGREFAPLLERIAIVTDVGWQRALPKIVSRFFTADAQVFAADQFDEAKIWLTSTE